MITIPDFVHLPYTPDLTEAGITYACRSLPYTFDRMGGTPSERMRRIAAGVAVELAFRRYLGEQGIPFDVLGSTPFTDPDHYDVALGGHRCDIKSFLVSHRDQISDLRRDQRPLLRAPALVPLDQFAGDTHGEQDLYIFAFVTGLIAPSQETLKQAIEAGQPTWLIHTLRKEWVIPNVWTPLGKLVLKSESDQPVTLELGGQDGKRDFVTETVELPPRTRIELENDYHSLACLHVSAQPGARVGVHSTARNETYLVGPYEWSNIWVYGMEIILAGYMSREDFRARASLIQAGSRVFQYNKTRTKNLAVPVADLRPLGELLEKVREWEAS
jgi:hypothetical protein